MNVRALPTCRKPVGDGAKRTRGFETDVDSGIVARVSWYVGKKSIVKRAGRANSSVKCLIPGISVPGHVLKSCCIRTPNCENIKQQSSPKPLIDLRGKGFSRPHEQ